MVHLKRIRRGQSFSSLLLAFTSTHPTPPPLPEDVELPAPYIVTVPRTAALTPTSLKLKSTLWPTIFAPRRKGEPEEWSRGKLKWAWEAMQFLTQEAKQALSEREVRPHPIYSSEAPTKFAASDRSLRPCPIRRRSQNIHSIRHSILRLRHEKINLQPHSSCCSQRRQESC